MTVLRPCATLVHVMGIIAAIGRRRSVGTSMSFYGIPSERSGGHGKVCSAFVIVFVSVLWVCRFIILESGGGWVIIGIVARNLMIRVRIISGHGRVVLLALVRIIVVGICTWCDASGHGCLVILIVDRKIGESGLWEGLGN